MDVGGQHYIVDMWGIPSVMLDNPIWIAQILSIAMHKGQMVERDRITRWREPHGITMIAGMEGGHVAIDTFPEENRLTADLLAFQTTADPEGALDVLLEKFEPEGFAIQLLTRGQPSELDEPVSGLSTYRA